MSEFASLRTHRTLQMEFASLLGAQERTFRGRRQCAPLWTMSCSPGSGAVFTLADALGAADGVLRLILETARFSHDPDATDGVLRGCLAGKLRAIVAPRRSLPHLHCLREFRQRIDRFAGLPDAAYRVHQLLRGQQAGDRESDRLDA